MDEQKTKIINRLRRIEGQVKGIERMLDSEQCCSDILVQVAAVRSAINKVGSLIFESLCPKLPGGGCNP
jgi:DNA-binding FrmR family transcriptional regulator